jgi:urease subunit beta/urease subunit gamma/beta
MVLPGEWILSDQPVEINAGRRTCKLKVRNTGDRPIQVGSHFHFFEVNGALDFDRPQAMGMHLNIPGGMAIRFEPGDEREVELVEFGGMKRVLGFNDLVDGGLTARWTVKAALERARNLGFKGMGSLDGEEAAITGRSAKEDHDQRVSPQDRGRHGREKKHQGKEDGQS